VSNTRELNEHELAIRDLLIGHTIAEVDFSVDDLCGRWESWTILTLVKDGKTTMVEVSRDPEGNGPGHLFIQQQEETD
jgi:hypothetical protein